MKRIDVVSSSLRSVGYDAASQTLEIEFNTGTVYQYTGVPSEVYEELIVAPSHGKYFAESIKDAYPYSRIR